MAKQDEMAAASLHKNVPPDWYHRSIREDPLQRYWHKRRFEEVGEMIAPVEGKVLDIGSADGVFSKVILDKSGAKEVIGLDVLKSSVDWANKHWKKNRRMKFKVGDAHKLSFKSNTFDAVFALEVLEHVFKPLEVLKEIRRVLKRKGYAVLLVPSESILFKIVWYLWHFYGRMVWEDTHVQDFRNGGLPAFAKKAGLKVVREKKFLLGMLHAVKVEKN